MVQIGQSDQPCLAQAREGQAHRLNRNAKVVGDIGAGHRQVNNSAFLRTLPLRKLQEKARDTLAGRLAAQQQHLLLRRGQLSRGAPEQRLLERRKLFEQAQKGRPRKAADPYRRHRLGAVDVPIGEREAQVIAWVRNPGSIWRRPSGSNLDSLSMPLVTVNTSVAGSSS